MVPKSGLHPGKTEHFGGKTLFNMGRIIAVFDSKRGQQHGFRDGEQAQDYLGISKAVLDDALSRGGGYLDGMWVSELIIHKSNRGGKR